MYEKIQESADFIRSCTNLSPQTAIITGSGLGNMASLLDVEAAIDYQDIPHFPVSTVKGHAGKLLTGRLHGKEVLVMQGRFHYYEGYSMQEVTFPIRVMKLLGIHTLIQSNACGAMNPGYQTGDLMVLNDQINLMGDSPLIGPNDERLGPRFPDMGEPYCPQLIHLFTTIARQKNIPCHQGVYAAISGPAFETPAEYKYLRRIGADVVGMSTVPETIVARHMDMKVLGVSIVTDLGLEGHVEKVSLEMVLEAAAKAEPKVSEIIMELIRIK